MDCVVIFIALGFTAHACAQHVQFQNYTPVNKTIKRFERGLSDGMLNDEMTAMDKIMKANEYQDLRGTRFKESDIAVSNRRSLRSCFARTCLWSKSVDGHVYIAYILSPEYSRADRTAIRKGMEAIENNTCVRFVPWTHQRDYLDVRPESGCWSYLGARGGGQILSLQAPDCMSPGIAAHELMHALGFVHEQSRADRDRYVTVLWSNVRKHREWNFEKYRTNNLDMPYDYSSIMHFGKFAYSDNGYPTIVPKRNPVAEMGQRFGPSDMDKFKINRLYNCGT